jgi:peptidoglycan/xylan/chitin deacetylase (PgdA/CDA1 family)
VNLLRRLVGPRGRPAARRLANALLPTQLGSIDRVLADTGHVALSFDDGPDALWTPLVLDVLAEHGARATFFVLLDRVRECPDLVRRAVAEGHDVGLHGADHRTLIGMSRPAVRAFLEDGRSELEQTISVPVTLFRPPFGAQSLRSRLAARDAGLECIVWAGCGWDWLDISEAEVAARALERVAAGDILLLHDGIVMVEPATAPPLDRAKVAELVLEGLGELGLSSESLTRLRMSGQDHLTAWFRH